MLFLTRIGLAISAAILFAGNGDAQAPTDTPEPVIRALVRAMYANDAPGFRKLTLPDSRIHLLTTGGSVNESGLRELDEDSAGLQIILKRSFEHKGIAVTPDAQGKYPVGTTAVYVVAHHRSPMVVIARQEAEGWKVDPRWWLAMVELTSADPPKPGTAEHSARALLAALISMNRTDALKYSTAGSSLEMLFLGAPSQREPSGHLDALAAEMPIVELAPGEFRRLPSGGIAKGTAQPDAKLLVGLLGSVEIPFLVQKIRGEWRVEPQPYFLLIEN